MTILQWINERRICARNLLGFPLTLAIPIWTWTHFQMKSSSLPQKRSCHCPKQIIIHEIIKSGDSNLFISFGSTDHTTSSVTGVVSISWLNPLRIMGKRRPCNIQLASIRLQMPLLYKYWPCFLFSVWTTLDPAPTCLRTLFFFIESLAFCIVFSCTEIRHKSKAFLTLVWCPWNFVFDGL